MDNDLCGGNFLRHGILVKLTNNQPQAGCRFIPTVPHVWMVLIFRKGIARQTKKKNGIRGKTALALVAEEVGHMVEGGRGLATDGLPWAH